MLTKMTKVLKNTNKTKYLQEYRITELSCSGDINGNTIL